MDREEVLDELETLINEKWTQTRHPAWVKRMCCHLGGCLEKAVPAYSDNFEKISMKFP